MLCHRLLRSLQGKKGSLSVFPKCVQIRFPIHFWYPFYPPSLLAYALVAVYSSTRPASCAHLPCKTFGAGHLLIIFRPREKETASTCGQRRGDCDYEKGYALHRLPRHPGSVLFVAMFTFFLGKSHPLFCLVYSGIETSVPVYRNQL